MSELVLKTEERKSTGKSVAKNLRRDGKIPGVYYFQGKETRPLAFDEKELNQIISSKPALISLQFDDGSSKEVVIREVQRNPVTDTINHVDMMGIKRGQKITVSVPVELLGEPQGIKLGGILEHITKELEIECFPKDIPDTLKVDVSDLDIGDAVHVSDLNFEKLRFMNVTDLSIASVVVPKVEVEPVAEDEEELEEGEEAAETAEEGEEASDGE